MEDDIEFETPEQGLIAEAEGMRNNEQFERLRAMEPLEILDAMARLIHAGLIRVIVFASPDTPEVHPDEEGGKPNVTFDNPDFDDAPDCDRDVCDMLGSLEGTKPGPLDKPWEGANIAFYEKLAAAYQRGEIDSIEEWDY